MYSKLVNSEWYIIFLFFLLSGSVHSQNAVSDTITLDEKKNNKKKMFTLSEMQLNSRNHYGFIPSIIDSGIPSSFSELDGQANIELSGLPFIVSYYYSNRPFVSGMRNYFTVSFDVATFRERARDKTLEKANHYKDSLLKVQKMKQDLERRREFMKYGKEHPEWTPPPISLPDTAGVKAPSYNLPDSSNLKIPSTYLLPDLDTILSPDLSDSSMIKVPSKPTLPDYDKELKMIDEELEKLNALEVKLKSYKNALEYKTRNGQSESPMSGFSRLSIGLFNPDFSTFLVSGLPVKGIYTEWEKNDFYLAFCTGITQSNFFNSFSPLDNFIKNKQNSLNFFDWNGSSGNKVMSIKTGLGRKDHTHLYGGILIGQGNPFHSSESTSNSFKNIVYEIDGKLKVSEKHSFQLVVGKSVLKSEDENMQIGSFYNTNDSYAATGSYQISYKKTKAEVTARYILPAFRSFGIGFMRSDNQRYEAKIKHTLTKWCRVGILYRYETDNLKNLYEITNHLTRMGGDITLKPHRKITLSGSYLPVNYKLTNFSNELVLQTKSKIVNAMGSWSHKIAKSNHTLNLGYNNILFFSDTGRINYENAMLISTLGVSRAVTNIFSATAIIGNSLDTTTNDMIILREELRFAFKKSFTVSVAGKYAFSNIFSESGYKISVQKRLLKKFSLEISMEKILRGEYFFSQDLPGQRNFPFYIYSLVQFNW